jgi:hypothetical protein
LTPSIDDDDDGIVVDDDARGKCGGLNTRNLERRLGPRRSEGRGACQSVLTPPSETGGLAVARRGGECRRGPYSKGVNELPTCREAPGVAARCRELWREIGKKKAKPFRLFVCSFVVNIVIW